MEQYRQIAGHEPNPAGLVSGHIDYLLLKLRQHGAEDRDLFSFVSFAEGVVMKELYYARYPITDLKASKLIFDHWYEVLLKRSKPLR